MKKIFFALLVFAAMAFIGCKDGDGDDTDNTPSLNGTVWEKVENNVSVKLTFQSSTNCQLVISSSSTTYASIVDYTYEYEHPTVMMYPKQDGMAKMKGLINNNVMNVINTSTGKSAYVLTKK